MSQAHKEPELDFDLIDRLRKSLRIAHMSGAQMADFLGVHRNTVTNYLAQRTCVDKRTLMLWAMRTRVPLDWLRGVGSEAHEADDLPHAS